MRQQREHEQQLKELRVLIEAERRKNLEKELDFLLACWSAQTPFKSPFHLLHCTELDHRHSHRQH